jgi:pyridoxal 5'-phosphate synthase pdxT subunit
VGSVVASRSTTTEPSTQGLQVGSVASSRSSTAEPSMRGPQVGSVASSRSSTADLGPGGWLRPHADQLAPVVSDGHWVGRHVGVLALQGAFAEHRVALSRLGCLVTEVRTPAQLAVVDALAMPGGESTTMSRLLATSGLYDVLAERLADGFPVFGTCAGMILLANHVADGRADQRSFGAIDISVRRNGYGRQVDSFEADLAVTGLDGPFRAVFIRAPKVESVGDDVTVLASVDDTPVLVQGGVANNIVCASFHPELTSDVGIHRLFLSLAFP